MTRHHAESNINILLTRNLPTDSGVRQWSHSLMIPMHSLWAKSKYRTCGQFECDVTWFCFCFDFVRSRARCGCRSIDCWRGCGGCSFKIGRPSSSGWKKMLDVDGQRVLGVWKIRQFSWTSYVYRPKEKVEK